ncbi:NUDIX hydrolase [Alteromonas sp. KUL49]|uniref:NUDIX hydrolase n=1 Tax=Alteromonas sp. KUL49 TaxID=2480798 RepID=UPI00102ED949|nr:NUDIX hydrolase [Alteromonas sp. KUL49]TAP42294.1 NUDIX hydrolase [Alteromonas sp. KUL49]GEA09900.1 DNA mismatch repair protein MutT [Alteromonas sp. KUL49]
MSDRGVLHLEEEILGDDYIDNISVDNLIFSMHEGKLKVLLAKYTQGYASNQWGLIGHWARLDENLNDAAARIVKQTSGVENLFLDQLGAFGQVNRYPERRIITVAFYSLVIYDDAKLVGGKNTNELAWFDVFEVPNLIFDHNVILSSCLEHLKYKVRHEPIGFNLLPEKFTLLQLQEIYEAILQKPLDKPNFRRKILKMNLLIDCKERQKNVAHRAASLYRFDLDVYHKLREFGFSFEY